MGVAIAISTDRLSAFCRKWRIAERSLFGSVLRNDFRPDSDVDVLIEFRPDHGWSLLDMPDLQQELSELLGREVDLCFKAGLRNPIRRRNILQNREILYAA